jgi:GNAT superfamily N-acetyltransferase
VQPAERAERDALRSFGAVPGIRCCDIGSAVCMSIPALPDAPMVNHIVGLGQEEPADEDVLDAAATFYDEVGVRYYACIAPSAQPDDLRERLAERGFPRGYDWMKFVRGVDAPVVAETTLDVRLVTSSAGDDFAHVVCGGFGMPASVEASMAAVPGLTDWSCYVAYDGGEPAAAGALFVSGDVGWLSLAATLPEHRRKGGQGAILAARIARAHELGVEALVTETGVREEGRASNSYRNILRNAFEEAYVRENYLSPPQD